MPATVVITLDTRAPQITWGAAGQVSAGELLRVGYTLDEPAIIAARLELVDGRVLAVDVLVDHLEALLPYDTPDGWAQLVVELEDDVGNAAEATLQVRIGGAIVEPSRPPGPGPARRRPEHRTITSPLRVRLRTGAGRLERHQPRRTVVARMGNAIARDTPPARRRSQPQTVRLQSAPSRLTAAHSSRGGVTLRSATTVSRRDGRELEEALLLGLM